MHAGYRGRTGVFEILIIDEMIRQLILDGKTAQEITTTARAAGTLRTLRDDAANKVVAGITTIEEAASTIMV